MILVSHFYGLRQKSLVFLLVAIAMAMTNKVCLSFFLQSLHSKKTIATKNLSICSRLYSSVVPSSDSINGATPARSPTFAIPERIVSQEESKRYEDLIRASKLQLAPMMEYTDRHFRHLIRLISGETLLYTEMVAANALSHERANSMKEYERSVVEDPSVTLPPSAQDIRENYPDQYLQRILNQGRIKPLEGPSVLQLGGSEPAQLYEAAQTVMDMVRLFQKLIES